MNYLAGYKTYLVAAAGIVTAWASYASGSISLGDAIEATITALVAAAIRSGVSTSTVKVINATKAAAIDVANVAAASKLSPGANPQVSDPNNVGN